MHSSESRDLNSLIKLFIACTKQTKFLTANTIFLLTYNSSQVRGSSGEHSEAKDGLYDVSNRERMGITEYEAVKKMHDGVKELIRMEKEKADDEEIDKEM